MAMECYTKNRVNNHPKIWYNRITEKRIRMSIYSKEFEEEAIRLSGVNIQVKRSEHIEGRMTCLKSKRRVALL